MPGYSRLIAADRPSSGFQMARAGALVVDDAEPVTRIKTQSPRKHPAVTGTSGLSGLYFPVSFSIRRIEREQDIFQTQTGHSRRILHSRDGEQGVHSVDRSGFAGILACEWVNRGRCRPAEFFTELRPGPRCRDPYPRVRPSRSRRNRRCRNLDQRRCGQSRVTRHATGFRVSAGERGSAAVPGERRRHW